jgi:ABC-type branched-subunit amino acid transport system substrate-binding protein
MRRQKRLGGFLAAVALFGMVLGFTGFAHAQAKDVVIGVLYPMTGPSAQIGIDAINIIKVALDIINNGASIDLPLAKSKGLPRLNGAKIRIVAVDTQGKADVGQAEAERLITQEKAVALFGAYQSNVTTTASQVAERMGIPFVNADSSSPALTERGYKWFFRTSPHDIHFSQVMFDFMKDLEKKQNVQLKSVAILNEDTTFGTDSAKAQEELAKKYDVSARAFTAFMTLADAINRAGSTDPAAIQKALRETNTPPEQLVMPWTGVKFDEKGQNIGVRAILQQLQDGTYHTVYPFDLATKNAIYPTPAWSQRK